MKKSLIIFSAAVFSLSVGFASVIVKNSTKHAFNLMPVFGQGQPSYECPGSNGSMVYLGKKISFKVPKFCFTENNPTGAPVPLTLFYVQYSGNPTVWRCTPNPAVQQGQSAKFIITGKSKDSAPMINGVICIKQP